jgi:hypothetical protein
MKYKYPELGTCECPETGKMLFSKEIACQTQAPIFKMDEKL